jgi:hypothetical protein
VITSTCRERAWERRVLRVFVLLACSAGCAQAPVRTLPAPGATPLLRRTTVPPAASPPPRAPFTFVAEDFEGDSPKFTVTDGAGVEWKVKLGPEAQTEIAAGALIAAAGYYVEEMHYLADVRVSGVAAMKRGRGFIAADGRVPGARFELRAVDAERGPNWDWRANPFVGTEALDGLRVLMMLINNYDARTANNRVLFVEGPAGSREARYVVTDLGASFGRCGGLGGRRSKGDLEDYRRSRFIDRVAGDVVTFAYRTRPEGLGLSLFVLNPFYANGELKKERDLNRIPIEHVRWIARVLTRLDRAALRSAFERAGFEPKLTAGFSAVVEDRIRALSGV